MIIGKEVDLPPESEEIAMFFAKLLGSAHVDDPVFQKNFFRDFTSVLQQYPPVSKILSGIFVVLTATS